MLTHSLNGRQTDPKTVYYLMEKITESPEGAMYLLKAPSLIYLITLQAACPLGEDITNTVFLLL